MLCALVLMASALVPLSAAAVVGPSPSLAQIMLPAPGGYTGQRSTVLSGSFTSQNLSSTWGTRSAEAQKALEQDGFVDGYGIAVVDEAAQRALIEYIVAFAGGQGAMDWLSYAQAGDKADPTYQHADSISGIDSYYGEHNVYPSHDVSDAFVFVKGNDLFVVGFESTRDDVLNLAISRAKNQYDSAPNSTIPTSQWPENFKTPASSQGTASPGTALALGGLIGAVFILALVVGMIWLVVALVRRSRPRPTAPDDGTWSAVQMSPDGGTSSAVHMSPDGGYWWDGHGWRDAAHEVPATAQRSADGHFWWDGRQWRPVV
jgi:hypothetical protein